jgi:hypothetical protein
MCASSSATTSSVSSSAPPSSSWARAEISRHRFASVAGWGDLAVGITLLAVLAFPRRPLVLAWNAFGLLDILIVFVTAQRLIVFVRDAKMLATFSQLPYSLLPVLIVPLVIATHLAIFFKMRRRSLPTP